MSDVKLPSAWADPTVKYDVRSYPEVEIQVLGTPSVAYTPQRSLNGTDFVACNVFDKDLNQIASITVAGIYSMDGGGYVKLTDGSGSTFSIRASA